MYQIDWSKAPPWANYHVFNADGQGVWCITWPEPTDKGTWNPSNSHSGYRKLADIDWKNSLEERRAEWTHQKEEIDWNKAPSWARYHVFYANGLGVWCKNKPHPVKTGLWEHDQYAYPSGYTIPFGEHWIFSLEERPS